MPFFQAEVYVSVLTNPKAQVPKICHEVWCVLGSTVICDNRAQGRTQTQQTQVFVPLTPTVRDHRARIIQRFRPAPPDERWIYVTFCPSFYFRFFPTLNQLTQHCVFDLKSIKIVAFYPLISLKHFDVEKIFHFSSFNNLIKTAKSLMPTKDPPHTMTIIDIFTLDPKTKSLVTIVLN